jgi:PAS domain S-box-containing protein
MKAPEEPVLIVDDETVVRRLLLASLAETGHPCLEAGSVEEAKKQLKGNSFAIVLLDIKMPGQSGMDFLSELLADHPDIAVIMISALSDSDTAIACMRKGAYDYIIKPFNTREVILRIEHALEKRRLILDNKIYRDHLEEIVSQQAGALCASEENFRNSLDNSPLGVRIVTADDRTIYANHALLDAYGYATTEEIDAIPYENRHTPESYLAHQERIRKRKLGLPVPSFYEIEIVRKNGEIRRLLVNRGEVLWNGEQQFQALYQDITERVQTEKALKASYDKLDKTLDAVIQTISLTVEIRDPYTAGHQHRVSSLACAIAAELGLPQDKINGIRVIGAIHDIGKIGVPAEILSKPGSITEAELSIIKEHPKTGYDILKGIDFPWPVALAVLQHHERMNGSGYPCKLSGDAIIDEARVLAVSDVVEAMASHRPYRPALGIDKALEEIVRGKGTIYDPDVVEACLKLFNEKEFKFE